MSEQGRSPSGNGLARAGIVAAAAVLGSAAVVLGTVRSAAAEPGPGTVGATKAAPGTMSAKTAGTDAGAPEPGAGVRAGAAGPRPGATGTRRDTIDAGPEPDGVVHGPGGPPVVAGVRVAGVRLEAGRIEAGASAAASGRERIVVGTRGGGPLVTVESGHCPYTYSSLTVGAVPRPLVGLVWKRPEPPRRANNSPL